MVLFVDVLFTDKNLTVITALQRKESQRDLSNLILASVLERIRVD